MKQLLFTCMLCLATIFGFATENKPCNSCSFTGTILDADTKEPLENVNVIIYGPSITGQQKVVTDDQGQYKLPTLPAGTYSLRFEKDEFTSVVKKNVIAKQFPVKLNIEMDKEESSGDIYFDWLLKSKVQ